MKLLEQLWKLADREAAQRNVHPDDLFADIGLNLDTRQFRNAGYFCTPINSVTFAETGGDGVHFGLLIINNEITDKSPAVMTVPMSGKPRNFIVGDNLLEFLSLGCEVGYAYLEEIAYGFWDKNVVDWFQQCKDDLDNNEKELLQVLINEFNLKPWTNVEARLDALDKQYLPLLQLKPDDD